MGDNGFPRGLCSVKPHLYYVLNAADGCAQGRQGGGSRFVGCVSDGGAHRQSGRDALANPVDYTREIGAQLALKEFVLNTVDDPTVLYQALYEREKINFGLAKTINVPVLTDSPASIEIKLVNTISREESLLLEAKVVYVHIRHRSELMNRAKGLVLESLILANRIPHLPEGKAEELLRENYRVVKKVAPGSQYEPVMQDVLNRTGAEKKPSSIHST